MGMHNSHLKPSNMVLEGFTAQKICVKGTVRINVTLGSYACSREAEVKFYVVDVDFPYNAILGTPTHSTFELSYQLSTNRFQFATRDGIGCVKSNPKSLLTHIFKSRKQRRAMSPSTAVGSVLTAKEVKSDTTLIHASPLNECIEPKSKEHEEFAIHLEYPDRKFQIGNEMPES